MGHISLEIPCILRPSISFPYHRTPIYYTRSSVYMNEETGQDPLLPALADATFEAYKSAVIRLPPDVLRVIKKAAAAETEPRCPRGVCQYPEKY